MTMRDWLKLLKVRIAFSNNVTSNCRQEVLGELKRTKPFPQFVLHKMQCLLQSFRDNAAFRRRNMPPSLPGVSQDYISRTGPHRQVMLTCLCEGVWEIQNQYKHHKRKLNPRSSVHYFPRVSLIRLETLLSTQSNLIDVLGILYLPNNGLGDLRISQL